MKSTVPSAWSPGFIFGLVSPRALCVGLVLSSSLIAAHAQPPSTQQGGQPPAATGQLQKDPELKLSPEKALEAFQPAADEPYRLGPGDEFTLDFPGRPELTKEGTGRMVVGPDGRITLPLAGIIAVGEKTREEAQTSILEAMSAYYTNLTVTLRIDKYASNKITMIGNVAHPGPIFFDETPTLLDAIAKGGLLPPTASPNGSASSVSRDGIPETCTIYRGHDQVVEVQLASLLRSHSPLADIRLRRNDIVFVPAQRENFVSVLGEVGRSGAVPLTPQSTVASVLAEAGSITEGAGNSPNIQIISPSTGQKRVISYKKLLSPSGNEIVLHSGDMIFVPKSGFYKATYVLQRLGPLATLAALVTIAGP